MLTNRNFVPLRMLAAGLLGLSLAGPVAAAPIPHPAPRVRSVILFVADGLGSSQRLLARLVQAGSLAMEDSAVWGMVRPNSLDSPAPDTAASCTALATGHKTRSNLLAIDAGGATLPTLLEVARHGGKLTGLVGNLTVTHASMAGFAAHATRRDDEASIAPQYVPAGPDVLLGGGERYFLPLDKSGRRSDGRNLEDEAQHAGYQVVRTAAELQSAQASHGKLMGLFAPGAMAYELDRPANDATQPSLAQMTQAAVGRLAQGQNGFVLVVNQGHLDWACHDHDVAAAAREVAAVDEAVKVAVEYQHSHADTLILVVGSHETAGLAIGPDFQADALRSARSSLERVAAAVRQDRARYEATLATLLGWTELKTEEKETVVLASEPDKTAADAGPGGDPLVLALGHILAARTGTAWATGEHTGTPCPLTALGSEARVFAGFYDDTEVPRRLARLLGLSLP